VTYNTVTCHQAAHGTYMFIWTPDSPRIGVIRVDQWGVITSAEPRVRAFARRVYRDLLRLGGKVVEDAGVDTLPDYKRIITSLLQAIK
jgi:hypothetical protein